MARLRNRSPLQELRNLEERLEEMFSSSVPSTAEEGNGREELRASSWVPQCDVYEQDGQIVVECECPGMDRDNIDVNLDDSVLAISGDRQQEAEVDDEDYYRSERYFDTFERSFRLPSDIDREAVKANYVDGLLKVTIPTRETGESTEIEIT